MSDARGCSGLETPYRVSRFALSAQIEPRFGEGACALIGQHTVHQRVIFGAGRADKSERRRPQAQFEQPAAVAADEVIVALGRRACDEIDLAAVQTQGGVKGARMRLACAIVRKVDARRTGLDDC